jgi:hypothetical protein
VPAEIAGGVIECIGKEANRLLACEGLRAFEMPRSSALAHEAGHCIVGAAEGLTIVDVRIFKRDIGYGPVWCGQTDEVKPWGFDPTTPTATMLARARYIIAGIAAEKIFDPDGVRAGSSIDEVVLSQLICGGVLTDRRDEFPGVKHPKELWSACWRQTVGILRRNEDAARSLMQKLDRAERLSGKPLAASLRRVHIAN